MNSTSRNAALRTQLKGLAMVLVVAALVAGAFLQFRGAFEDHATVTVSAPRAGLVLDPDAKVKLRGVQIGRVTSMSQGAGVATLTLALDPAQLKLIPANVKVDIQSTTVFGAKYVNFVLPDKPESARLRAGAHLAATAVTVEYNTLFQHLQQLLAKVHPEQLNATLTAIATALHGRGEALGQLIDSGDSYLATINPMLQTLKKDFDKTAEVANLYADNAPNLLRAVDNATVTSDTIVAEHKQLNTVLLSVLGLNETTGGVLRANQRPLATALDTLRSTTNVLGVYSPALYCSIVALDKYRPLGERIFGGNQEGVAFNSGFMPPPVPYQIPNDLPKVAATGGPNCWGLPDGVPDGAVAPYVVTDTSIVPFAPPTRSAVGGPKLWEFLYDGLVPTSKAVAGAEPQPQKPQPKTPGAK
ncbi:MAG: MCE family protein [Mycobacteriaceae bacterium]|nr:MCE family protein [Mycobacteriaceae bacterium]